MPDGQSLCHNTCSRGNENNSVPERLFQYWKCPKDIEDCAEKLYRTFCENIHGYCNGKIPFSKDQWNVVECDLFNALPEEGLNGSIDWDDQKVSFGLIS
jgi:hypothetical protein